MAVAYMIISFSLGPVLVLKATRNTRPLFHIQLVSISVSVLSLSVLSVIWGVNGAAGAMIVTYGASAAGLRWVQHRVLRGHYRGGRETVGQSPPDGSLASRPESGVESVF
jgi:hypothetical protein